MSQFKVGDRVIVKIHPITPVVGSNGIKFQNGVIDRCIDSGPAQFIGIYYVRFSDNLTMWGVNEENIKLDVEYYRNEKINSIVNEI